MRTNRTETVRNQEILKVFCIAVLLVTVTSVGRY